MESKVQIRISRAGIRHANRIQFFWEYDYLPYHLLQCRIDLMALGQTRAGGPFVSYKIKYGFHIHTSAEMHVGE